MHACRKDTPNDGNRWLALACWLGDNGRDVEAVAVHVHWPTRRDILACGSLAATLADLARNTKVPTKMARKVERQADGTSTDRLLLCLKGCHQPTNSTGPRNTSGPLEFVGAGLRVSVVLSKATAGTDEELSRRHLQTVARSVDTRPGPRPSVSPPAGPPPRTESWELSSPIRLSGKSAAVASLRFGLRRPGSPANVRGLVPTARGRHGWREAMPTTGRPAG